MQSLKLILLSCVTFSTVGAITSDPVSVNSRPATVTASAQDEIPEIWITQDSDGRLVYSYWILKPDGSFNSVPVRDIRFIERIGMPSPPIDPVDPVDPPSDFRLKELEAEVKSFVSTVPEDGAAQAVGVILSKMSDGLRSGKVSTGGIFESLSAVYAVLFQNTDPKWKQFTAITKNAFNRLRSFEGQNPTAVQYAETIEAMIRGLGDQQEIRLLAESVVARSDQANLEAAMIAISPAIDWQLWLPIILQILKLFFPSLGF